jgi:hypothetical protein
LSKLPDRIDYRISDNSKLCNGPVNFEITRFTYIYREWMWSRVLDVRLSEWCCSVSMVWVQIPSREEQNIWQLKNLILTLFGLIFRRIYIYILLVFIFIIYHIYIYYYNKYIFSFCPFYRHKLLLYKYIQSCRVICIYCNNKYIYGKL